MWTVSLSASFKLRRRRAGERCAVRSSTWPGPLTIQTLRGLAWFAGGAAAGSVVTPAVELAMRIPAGFQDVLTVFCGAAAGLWLLVMRALPGLRQERCGADLLHVPGKPGLSGVRNLLTAASATLVWWSIASGGSALCFFSLAMLSGALLGRCVFALAQHDTIHAGLCRFISAVSVMLLLPSLCFIAWVLATSIWVLYAGALDTLKRSLPARQPSTGVWNVAACAVIYLGGASVACLVCQGGTQCLGYTEVDWQDAPSLLAR